MDNQVDSQSLGKVLAAQCGTALALIGAMSTAAHLLLSSILATQTNDAVQINVSGRQRMFSQRVTLLAHRLVAAETEVEHADVLNALTSAIDLMEASHHALVHGDASWGICPLDDKELQALYLGDVGLDRRVREFIRIAREFTQEPRQRLTLTNPYLHEISEVASHDLLVDLNKAVSLYEASSNDRTALLIKVRFYVWTVTLFLLVGVEMMIFRPMILRIESQLDENIAANRELVDKDRRIQLLLNSAGDGFLPVGLDGRVLPGVSSKVITWFGDVPVGEFFWDAIAVDSDESIGIQLGFEQIVSDVLPFDVAVSQAVAMVKRGELVLGIDYRELSDDGKRTGFLLVIRNITSDLVRETSEAESRELSRILRNVMQDQHSFSRFVAETRSSLVEAGSPSKSASEAARLLHTIKGNTSIFGFHQFSRHVHSAEESLLSGEAATLVIPALVEDWDRRTEQFQEITDRRDDVWISRAEHDQHIDHLTKAGCCDDLIPEVRRWSFESARRNMEQIAKATYRLAGRLNKKVMVQLEVEDGLRLDAKNFGGIWSSLIHVVRNSMDHGIESPEQRRAIGKPTAGRLDLRCFVESGYVQITVSDDGGGIDWEQIRSKAATLGVPADGPEAMKNALFSDGLSSRDQATEISGRGVGMGSLKDAVEKQDGTIDIKSELGLGTQVIISIPLPRELAYVDLLSAELCELD